MSVITDGKVHLIDRESKVTREKGLPLEKVLITDLDKCTGCRVCELVCSMVNKSEINPRKSHIKVMKNKEMDVDFVALGSDCTFCQECVHWCLPEALEFVDMDEAVVKYKAVRAGKIPAPLFNE